MPGCFHFRKTSQSIEGAPLCQPQVKRARRAKEGLGVIALSDIIISSAKLSAEAYHSDSSKDGAGGKFTMGRPGDEAKGVQDRAKFDILFILYNTGVQKHT